MDNSKQLAQLHDIHLPPAISAWPLAPGWYFFGLVLILALVLTGFILRQITVRAWAKKEALKLLSLYQKEYRQNGDTQLTSARISALLKRVALAYYPRVSVASLQGEDWLAFLNQTSQKLDFSLVRDELLLAPYRAPAEQLCDLNSLFTLARKWIKQRRKPCLK